MVPRLGRTGHSRRGSRPLGVESDGPRYGQRVGPCAGETSVGAMGCEPNLYPSLPDGKFLSAVARFGPTTPTRARRLADASVDPTDARNFAICCGGLISGAAHADAELRGHEAPLPRHDRPPAGTCADGESSGASRLGTSPWRWETAPPTAASGTRLVVAPPGDDDDPGTGEAHPGLAFRPVSRGHARSSRDTPGGSPGRSRLAAVA
jgi:hypothetical protein